MQAIVNYCFSGRIEICANNADDILDAAASMEFPALEGMVSEFWCSRLSVENCVETLAKADQYNLTYLWEETLQFCATNFDKIPVCDMMDMDVAIFEKLIAFDKIAVIEDRIFECVVNWLHRNEKRAKFAPTILKLIRLKHISPTVNSISTLILLPNRTGNQLNCFNLISVLSGACAAVLQKLWA